MRVVIRVDGSTTIGAGHVVRCAALAEQLKSRGADVRFVCREQDGDYCDWLEGLDFDVSRLPMRDCDFSPEVDAAQTYDVLRSDGRIDWLVVDHYGIGSRWETRMRALVNHVFVIDDIPNRCHSCDLLLNQNVSIAGDDVRKAKLPSETTILEGPRYALLRPEFARMRLNQRVRDGIVRRIMICFGGSDPQNHTSAAVTALRSKGKRIEHIDVVVGNANPHKEAVFALCSGIANAVFHSSVDLTANLMAKADLAVGAGGSMTWERACLGLPTIAFGIAENQREVLEKLIEMGCLLGTAEMLSPNVEKMSACLSIALDNPSLLRGLAQRAAELTDGLGAERVADAMFPQVLNFRRATIDDSELIFRSRNDPNVRSVSRDSREIAREEHEEWMRKTLSSSNCILLIAEFDGRIQGVVRFDLRSMESTISVYRVPSTETNTRLGLVKQATEWLNRADPSIQRVIAEIVPGNVTSLAAFRAAGYRDKERILEIELERPWTNNISR